MLIWNFIKKTRIMRIGKFLAVALLTLAFGTVYAQTKTKVMVMEIRSEIDPRMKRYVELALGHAEKTKADYVIVDMDTYGGVLTDAKEIVDLIMGFKKPVWVFINSDAASAGALISIACDSIYMAPGASIGAATVVEGGGGQAAPDKYQSYMRSIMRSTAEENGRNPRIAEGIQQRERATMSLTAVVEDGFNVGDESIKFAIVTMEDSGIKLVKVNEMPPYAELARQELHL